MTEIETVIYRERIQADFPELRVNKVKVIGTGWDHVAIEVNETLIFRIPHEDNDLSDYFSSVVHETAVLKYLKGKLPVVIPDPIYIAPANAYFGYTKLKGEKLANIWPSFSASDKANLWGDWVNIAAAVHKNMPLDLARNLGIKVFAGSADNAPKIFDLKGVDKEVLNFARKTIEAAEAIGLQKLPVVFLHNDLQFNNLLFDPKTKRITVVIDWSDACVGPVEREFSVWEHMHDNQLDEVAARYTAKTGYKIDKSNAKVWYRLETLSDYVELVESNQTKEAEEILSHIKKWIQEA